MLRRALHILPRRTRRRLARAADRLRRVPPVRVAEAPPAQASPFPAAVATPNLLTDLGERFQPTKRYHHYLPYYWMHLRDIREQVRVVVEIGVESDRSVRMWEAFFPNATIVGIDVNPACRAYESGRVRIFIGPQQDTAFLARCLADIGAPPDVVIDDGSHRPADQMITFNYLFPRLSDHGVYVVEDTGGVVEDEGLRTVNRLKALIDAVFYWPAGGNVHWTTLSEFPPEAGWLARNVTGVAFYRSIVFVMRGRNPGDNPHVPMSADLVRREGLTPMW